MLDVLSTLVNKQTEVSEEYSYPKQSHEINKNIQTYLFLLSSKMEAGPGATGAELFWEEEITTVFLVPMQLGYLYANISFSVY